METPKPIRTQQNRKDSSFVLFGYGKRRSADVLVEALEREGVTDVFAYPDGASMEIHQALTRSSSIQNVQAPPPIGFAVFLVHLATIPITGTGINPARSLGAAIVYNQEHAWDDHWIFWVGPFIGAALAALYHQIVIGAIPFKSKA
ncbi:hypothetical protein G4B88_006840 [Cannabis sativa]|uniref:Aquaporin n=1 Tax=Cannabis sativa TaxID=3483 RepID=A0A7J6G649_CANSA|nr:hypothetical protein G4B88_006840 [Cannabis sativa]